MTNADIIEVTTETFEEDVLNHTGPVLVAFYAQWCEPCSQLAPVITSIAQQFTGRLRIARLDVDADDELANLFGIQSVPSLKLIIGGQLLGDWTGLVPEELLAGGINTALEVAANKTGAS